MFVHKVLFTLQEHVKITKTGKRRIFFFAKKMMNLLPNTKLFNIVSFQSTKNKKKELCVDNKVQETIGDMFCPTRRNEKCVFFSAKFPGSMIVDCFARKTSRDHTEEKSSPFRRRFSDNHNQAYSNLSKKVIIQSIYGINVSNPHWLIQLTKCSLPFSFHTLSITVKQHDFLSLQRRY